MNKFWPTSFFVRPVLGWVYHSVLVNVLLPSPEALRRKLNSGYQSWQQIPLSAKHLSPAQIWTVYFNNSIILHSALASLMRHLYYVYLLVLRDNSAEKILMFISASILGYLNRGRYLEWNEICIHMFLKNCQYASQNKSIVSDALFGARAMCYQWLHKITEKM